MSKDCVVVIPVYKALDIDERMSLEQLVKMTPNFAKVFVVPQSLILQESYDSFRDFQVVRFDDCFFDSIQSYNRLMLNQKFYDTFSDYKYMLIHQTDAYLFKDELAYWCSLDYDYLGAPWYTPKRLGRYKWFKFAFRYLTAFYSKVQLVRRRSYNCVGNGGLSLRKIESFKKVLSLASPKLLEQYLSDDNRFFNEDVFWSVEAPEIDREYKVPDYEIGIYFALESESEKLFKIMGSQLPFGCHGFKKADPIFWKQHIPYELDQ